MKLATNNQYKNPEKLGVLLDLGRYSNSFDYIDGRNLGVDVGDIVLVKLKGTLSRGLVVTKSNILLNLNKDKKSGDFKYLSIEKIVQKSIFDYEYREWIENLAKSYRVSLFKMFKTAMPPGWIGRQNNQSESILKQNWIMCLDKNLTKPQNLTSKQLLLFSKVKEKGGSWQAELLKDGFTYSQIDTLVKGKLFSKIKKKKENQEFLNSFKKKPLQIEVPELTVEQKKAYDLIEFMKPGEVLLLWGETGSGKTEIYLRIVRNELKNGKSCLILAPEIGLIPQLIDRFCERFKDNIFEYHSSCSSKHRKLVWQRISESNEPIIIIGTRSAIFLPIRNLGLIILDEEHDNSYKQETPMPCYDAREVALDRAWRNNSKLIFGSATPSMSLWKKIYFEEKFKMIRMKKRISNTKIPEIRVVDMREEFKNGNKRILSNKLLSSLKELRAKKEQAIILIPRRGYNGFLSCRSCGFVVNCPNCDSALSVHVGSQGTRWLSCHWCNLKKKYVNTCPDCNSNAFKPFGIGTQKVVEFINDELPQLKILRFDRDTTSGKDGHRKILSEFSNGDADVLVGTQMLAKGIDIPNVTLSVVLAADGLLHRPDLSAEEKALQLFLQLAGRSGRADKVGLVIFQTYQPNHPIIDYFKKRDYERFLIDNAKIRKESNLYPFCRICLIKISGKSYELTEEAANKISSYLKPHCEKNNWRLVGPAPSLISRIGNKFRWQILIYGPENSDLPSSIGINLWKIVSREVNLMIDINPVEI